MTTTSGSNELGSILWIYKDWSGTSTLLRRKWLLLLLTLTLNFDRSELFIRSSPTKFLWSIKSLISAIVLVLILLIFLGD